MNIREQDGSVTFEVRVIPRSSKSEIVGEHNGALKVKLKSPPVDGAANDELVRLIARAFDIAKSDVEIVSGQTSRSKQVRVRTREPGRITAILNAKT